MWSPTVSDGDITLRLIRQRDAGEWREVRRRNREWLQPWEASLPPEASLITDVPATFGQMVRRMRKDARAGRALPWAILVDGRLAGQLTVGGITYGSLRSAYIGYWIDKDLAGRGIMPAAVALACDYCFDNVRLHRIEINIRPENTASLRVVDKIGLRKEGDRPKYLHIDGDWRDHVTYVVMAGEFPDGVLSRLKARQASVT
ncbi:MAG: GNAT family N-acetyltransferase [Actinobacteria bacterium]|nr:GNAT family N-acetyltransferase [Actinomycetota bacterium]